MIRCKEKLWKILLILFMTICMVIANTLTVYPISKDNNTTVEIKSNYYYEHKEIIGSNRYETGYKVVEESEKTKNIIVISSMVDGLCASSLTGILDASILPINPKKISENAKKTIEKAEQVYVIGGYDVIPRSFENQFKNIKINRISGKNRFETSKKIAQKIGKYNEAYIVNGISGEADAMSIASVAAREKSPVILTRKYTSSVEKKEGVNYTVIGGTAVISENIQKKFDASRISGEDRYETNREVINTYYPGKTTRYFTNGETLIDAIAGSSISKNNGMVFINEKKNHDMLEYKNTVQIGGLPFEIKFINTSTPGTGIPPVINPPIERTEIVNSSDINIYISRIIRNQAVSKIVFDFVDEKEFEEKGSILEGAGGKVYNDVKGYVDNETIYIVSPKVIKISENIQEMFAYHTQIESIDLTNLDTSNVVDMSYLFCQDRDLKEVKFGKYFDTSSVENMSEMFFLCENLISLDLRNFDTSKVTDMRGMFFECTNLISLDLRSFDTSKVTNMYGMFYACKSLTSLNLSSFDTSKVTNMNGIFSLCEKLGSIKLSNFDTSKVVNMGGMFYACKSLTNLDLSSFDTSSVENMSIMFSDCISLTSLDLSNFDTSKVTNMLRMFSGCKSLVSLDLSNFNTSKVLSMQEMFSDCTSLTSLDLRNFDTSSVENMSNMFSDCKVLGSVEPVELTIMNETTTVINLISSTCEKKNPSGTNFIIKSGSEEVDKVWSDITQTILISIEDEVKQYIKFVEYQPTEV